jgi:hypothetical protein
VPRAEPSRRVERCAYVESGSRCRKSASGNPPLCNAHRIVVIEQARREMGTAGRPTGDGIIGLFDRILNKKRVDRRTMEDAVQDAADLFKWYTEQRAADTDAPPREPMPGEQHGQRTQGRNWWDPIVNEARQRTQQRTKNPPDPRAAELKAARARARVTLGFPQTDKLTEALIKARQKELARKHHPDVKGGSTTKMQEINAAVDVLMAELVTSG